MMYLRKKYIFSILIPVIFSALLTGCAETEVPQDNIGAASEEKKTQEEMPQTEEGIQQAPSEETAENSSSICVVSPNEDISWAVCSEGIFCYGTGEYGMCGYISEDGEEITPCMYEEAMPFSEGLACARLDGKYGFIGKDGETVLPFIYDQASSFREGTAYFSIGEEYGLIDWEGNVITELTDCDSISSFREGLAYFSVDGQYGYMDKNGKAEPLFEAGECGGSMGGDRLCLWYDTKEGTLKPGTSGSYGGFGGSLGSEDVYILRDGEAVLENSFQHYYQSASNYSEETLLENAELFYDEEGEAYTKDTILEAEYVEECIVNDKQVPIEEYSAAEERYLYYNPLLMR